MTADTDIAADPGRDFAELMNSAAAAAAPAFDEAPFGFTTDRVTGERRPKKAAGRPRKSPSLDELRAARAEAQASADPASPPAGDRAPSSKRRRARDTETSADRPDQQVRYSPGMITKGVNRLYRRAGKIVRAMDRDIGIAIIEATKNTAEGDEPDDSVGAAWEEVCRTNPRIRRFVLRVIAGGAWGQLFMAHAPILLAIILKDGIRKHLPMASLLEAFLSDDEDQGDGDGETGGLAGLLDGMEPGDLRQMMAFAQQMMGGMAARAAA